MDNEDGGDASGNRHALNNLQSFGKGIRAWLRSVRTLRKVLDTWEDLLSPILH